MKHIEDKKVRDLMTYGVVTVPEYAKVINVIKILTEGYVHGVVVVGKEGKAAGVISEIDISNKIILIKSAKVYKCKSVNG